MSRDARVLLVEMQTAAFDIIEFSMGLSKEAFLANRMAKLAVIRSFEVMGEAAKGVPASIRDAHPEIPWKEICGMRDVLIHQYFGIDEDLLWLAVENRVPLLLKCVTSLLEAAT